MSSCRKTAFRWMFVLFLTPVVPFQWMWKNQTKKTEIVCIAVIFFLVDAIKIFFFFKLNIWCLNDQEDLPSAYQKSEMKEFKQRYYRNVIIVPNDPKFTVVLFYVEENTQKVHTTVGNRVFLEPLNILWKKTCLLETLQGRWWWSDPSGPFCALARGT